MIPRNTSRSECRPGTNCRESRDSWRRLWRRNKNRSVHRRNDTVRACDSRPCPQRDGSTRAQRCDSLSPRHSGPCWSTSWSPRSILVAQRPLIRPVAGVRQHAASTSAGWTSLSHTRSVTQGLFWRFDCSNRWSLLELHNSLCEQQLMPSGWDASESVIARSCFRTRSSRRCMW
jgi:hypothetical protein